MHHTEEKPDYFYLRYATLGQFFEQVKAVAPFWCYSSAGFLLLSRFNIPRIHNTCTDLLDRLWIWPFAAFSIWLLRGKTLVVPKLSLAAWIFLNTLVGIGQFADALLPTWLSWAVNSAFFLMCLILWELIRLGKATLEQADSEAGDRTFSIPER